MDEWFYALNDAQLGPVPRATLLQLLNNGQLPANSLVWRDGMPDWVAANAVSDLAGIPRAGVQPVLGYGMAESTYIPVNLQIRYAGFWIRFCGAFLDGIVVAVAGGTISAIVGPVIRSGATGNPNVVSGTIGANWTLSTAIGWLYVALMQSSEKQATLGQMATGLRVTDLQGRRIGFARATGRYFATILSSLIIYIGYFMMLWSPTKQTLHDKLAGTLVLTT